MRDVDTRNQYCEVCKELCAFSDFIDVKCTFCPVVCHISCLVLAQVELPNKWACSLCNEGRQALFLLAHKKHICISITNQQIFLKVFILLSFLELCIYLFCLFDLCLFPFRH